MGDADQRNEFDALKVTVKMNIRAPPIGLLLDVSENDVLDGSRHAGDLPGN